MKQARFVSRSIEGSAVGSRVVTIWVSISARKAARKSPLVRPVTVCCYGLAERAGSAGDAGIGGEVAGGGASLRRCAPATAAAARRCTYLPPSRRSSPRTGRGRVSPLLRTHENGIVLVCGERTPYDQRISCLVGSPPFPVNPQTLGDGQPIARLL